MRIFIMRHGEAQNFASSDAERPLTIRGEQQSKQAASQLATQLEGNLDLVWVSPYLRAQQTWQVMTAELPEAKKVVTADNITPYGDSEDVAAYLKALIAIERPETVMLISHLPLVGYLTADIVAGIQPPMFRTSAIAAIDYDPDTEVAEFLWQDVPS
ncbi:phosphohistidine phosphatase SixA [Photobacterium frigidiphilum]|uniref:phosphohistidine phosphatase SixA n=1 Tax=Photobacterium frigidiphilum TaxID=264736 RepID=UPI003D150A76